MSKHFLYDWHDYVICGDEPDWVESYTEFCEINNRPIRLDPDAVRDYAIDCSEWDWEDEESNLRYSDPIEGTAILCVARLGLWTGRTPAWKVINSRNLADCLAVDELDYVEMYTEGGQFVIRNTHHDGTNYYTFYAIKGDPDELEERLYNGADAIGLTADGVISPLGNTVNKIYGWED